PSLIARCTSLTTTGAEGSGRPNAPSAADGGVGSVARPSSAALEESARLEADGPRPVVSTAGGTVAGVAAGGVGFCADGGGGAGSASPGSAVGGAAVNWASTFRSGVALGGGETLTGAGVAGP